MSLLTGVVLDAMLGDPPNQAHPVAWFGRVASGVDRAAPRGKWAGAAVTPTLIAAVAALVFGVRRVLPSVLAEAGAVWLCLSRRTLLERAREVAAALEADDLPEARRLLAYHLVSRDTSELTGSEVAGAAIESVAENLSDGVVAPAFWYVIGGAPAAAAYRATNTLDGMWGYRTPRYESFGWAAARGDDLANLVPARLTALAITLASADRVSGALMTALMTWRSDRGLTESPNAGHPMAAMAGALGVRLRKRGPIAADRYCLNEGGREPSTTDLRRAIALADRASFLALGSFALAARGRS